MTREETLLIAILLESTWERNMLTSCNDSNWFSNWKNAIKEKKGFQKHESSDSHMEAVARYVTAPATVIGDIGDLLSERHALEKSKNRKILPTILSNIRYLARQALPLSGDWNTETRSEENSNFHWAAETTPLKKIHKARGIAHNCSDMTCTKKYALIEGPKRGWGGGKN